jgi:head-tail adaptor
MNHQLNADINVVMFGRFADLYAVLPDMRVSLSNEDSPETFRRFDIQSIADPDGRRTWMKMSCVERVRF